MMQQKQVTGCEKTDVWEVDSVTMYRLTIDYSGRSGLGLVDVFMIQTDNGWKIDRLDFIE